MAIRNSPPFPSRARLAAEVKAQGSITDYIGDMVSAHAPDGTYEYVSMGVRELFGYEPEDLIGNRAYAFISPDDAAKVGVAHQSALDGAPFTVTYRLRCKDNEYVWVETTTRTILDEQSGDVAEMICCTRRLENRRIIDTLSSDGHREALERIQSVIDEEGIGPVYQAIFDLETEEVIAYEALSRFPGDPARGPDRWFEEAWAVGMGIPLELLAVRIASQALDELPDRIGLSVNASPPTISSGSFLSSFDGMADRITVELTEHLHVDDYESFTSKLGPLRQAGGQVAIDDFGAGYASLRHILKVRPEWIKLDISLTERIDENPIAYALASSLVSFAGDAGVRAIAEGIETEDELDALLNIGFRYGQGFYFGVPAPLDEALAKFN